MRARRHARSLTCAVVAGAMIAFGALAESATESAHAGLRVLLAAPNGTAILVQVAGAQAYRAETDSGVGHFALLPPGSNRVTLWTLSVDDGPEAASDRLATLDVDLEGGAYHTMIVTFPVRDGVAAAVPVTQQVETILFHDVIDHLPRAGHASLRVVHAAPSSGSIHVAVRSFDPEAVEDASDPAGGEVPAAEAGDGAEAAGVVLDVLLEPLGSSDRLEVREGIYLVTPRRGDEASVGEPLRYDLRHGVAYTLYLTSATADGVAGRLVVDAARPQPPQRERER